MGSAWIIAMVSFLAFVMSFQEVDGWKVVEVKGWKGEEVEFLHVGGKVLCQDCSQGWNHWLHEATPLKGRKVAVTCMDARRKRAVYFRSGETDERGEFDIAVNVSSRRANGREMRAEGCSVRLLSRSPEQATAAICSVMANFGGGKAGVKLYSPSHVGPGFVKYTVAPFYFTSPMCDDPEPEPAKRGGGGY